ncbi:MAG: hypothetical protein GXP62_09115 [Oligoflexia bacterium]|nr:hypothetical protein [Oligoflexia bacterium]
MAEPGSASGSESSDEGIIEEDEDLRLPVKPPPISFAGGRRALTVGRTLRGGQRVQFPGDVIVFGDVNPGAAVEAGGHILVMGSLRGMAHAGMYGDAASVILAFDLRPTQLRIGAHIAFPEDPGSTDHATRGRGAVRPELACVKGDDIFIQAYTGRLPVLLAPSSSPHDAASTTGSAVTESAHTE